MKDRETACWIVGGALALFTLFIGGIGHYEVKIVTVKAEAWVQVAHEIGEGIASLTN